MYELFHVVGLYVLFLDSPAESPLSMVEALGLHDHPSWRERVEYFYKWFNKSSKTSIHSSLIKGISSAQPWKVRAKMLCIDASMALSQSSFATLSGQRCPSISRTNPERNVTGREAGNSTNSAPTAKISGAGKMLEHQHASRASSASPPKLQLFLLSEFVYQMACKCPGPQTIGHKGTKTCHGGWQTISSSF